MDNFESITLDNGLELVGQRLPGVQSAAFAFFVRHGAVDDTWDVAGLAHLSESTMFRGTANRSSRDLTEELDRLGVGRSSSTGLEATLFTGMMLGDHLLPALVIFFDILRFASFPEQELQAVRALQLQEIGQRNDQPAQLVMDRARQLYFAGHPLGHDSLGSVDSVTSLSRDQVVENWSRWYQPSSITLAVAGNFEWPQVVEQVSRLSAEWRGESIDRQYSEPGINPAVVVEQTGAAQENMCFTFPGVAYGDSAFYAAALASTVLGSGMNSRLFTEVREKRGLAYSVGARADSMSSTGLVRVYAGTQPERASETVETIQAQLRLLQDEGVSDGELELAKTRVKSRVIMSSESTGNRVMAVGRDWFYERRFRTLASIREAIDAVTREDIMTYLNRVDVTGNLGLVALGPLTAAELGVEDRAFEPATQPAGA